MRKKIKELQDKIRKLEKEQNEPNKGGQSNGSYKFYDKLKAENEALKSLMAQKGVSAPLQYSHKNNDDQDYLKKIIEEKQAKITKME